MITVLYARLGETALVSLLSEVKERFSHPDCAKYIDSIAEKSNAESARESLAALVLLGRAAEWMWIDTEDLALDRSQNGKPFFRDSSVAFSLTHSKGYIAAALSDEGEVGIDIEASDYSREKAQKLAQRYFCDGEKEEFARAPEGFLRIWTKKEALFKLGGDPKVTDIRKIDTESANAIFEESTVTLDGKTYLITVCRRINKAIF